MSPGSVLLACLLQAVLRPSYQAYEGKQDHAALQIFKYWTHHRTPKNYTTSSGEPVADRLNVWSAGKKGPMVLLDTHYFDDMQHFDRERIPERVVNAKGAGAWGFFKVTNTAITKYSKALVFNKLGKTTAVFCRFSTITGQAGSTDLFREMRGFAVKMYTEDGNWDVVGSNFPVCWIRDPLLFPSLIHSQKKNPVTGCRDWTAYWDFASLVPSCKLALMMIHTSRGIPKSYRHMHGYGVNTFVLRNRHGEVFYAKFHFRSNQGIKNWSSEEATRLSANEPDYCIKDLYNAICDEDFPSWNMSVQIMTPSQCDTFPWDCLDCTKFWPEDMYPLIPVGVLTLNENPRNYFAEVEQVAFKPSNLVPGIEASSDRILQGRMIPYQDAAMYRMCVNYEEIPVNQPLGQRWVANTHRDGTARRNNQAGEPNYYPNSFHGVAANPRGTRVNFHVHGNASRYNNMDDDNYSQPTMFWNRLDETEKNNMVDNYVITLSKVIKTSIQERVEHMCWRVHKDFGRRLREALQKANHSGKYY